MTGAYWERFHWSYVAAMAGFTIWDWIGAEGYARLHQCHVGEPDEATRAMAVGVWMAVREQRKKAAG